MDFAFHTTCALYRSDLHYFGESSSGLDTEIAIPADYRKCQYRLDIGFIKGNKRVMRASSTRNMDPHGFYRGRTVVAGTFLQKHLCVGVKIQLIVSQASKALVCYHNCYLLPFNGSAPRSRGFAPKINERVLRLCHIQLHERHITPEYKVAWCRVIVIGTEENDNRSKGVVTGHTPEETSEMMTYSDNRSPLTL